MTPREAFDALLCESVPCRITPPDPYCYADGPTARWLELERQRVLWAVPTLFEDEEGAA